MVFCFFISGGWAAEKWTSGMPPPRPLPPIPEAFADASAVVLDDLIHWTVSEKWSSWHEERRILLRNQDGYDNADQAIFIGEDEKLISFAARTVQPDGTIVEVPADLKHEILVEREGKREVRALHFTFPAVSEGSVIEWSYTLEERADDDVNWLRWWYAQRHLPVVQTRLKVFGKHPKKYTWQLGLYQRPDPSPYCVEAAPGEEKGWETYEITCRNLPAFFDDDFTPPEADGLLTRLVTWEYHFSLPYAYRYWGRAGYHLYSKLEELRHLRGQATALGAEIAKNNPKFDERLAAVIRYLREKLQLRESTRREWPGPAKYLDSVLKTGGGTHDELNLLAGAMLEAMEYKVYPVFAFDLRDGRFKTDMPTFDNDGALLLEVVRDGQSQFFDPACQYCPHGMIDDRRYGGPSQALRLDGYTEAHFIDIPMSTAASNVVEYEERQEINLEGDASVSGTIRWKGIPAVAMRQRWSLLEASARGKAVLSVLPKELQNVTVEGSNPEDPAGPTEARYSGHVVRVLDPVGNRRLLRPFDVNWLWMGLPVERERKSPIARPVARTIRQKVVFVLPSGFDVESTPVPAAIRQGGDSFTASWHTSAKTGELTLIGELVTQRDLIEPGGYLSALSFSHQVAAWMRDGVVLAPAGIPTEGGGR